MKKNLLLVGLFFISILANGQKYEMIQKTNKIPEFNNRMFLSTSKDPLAIIKSKTTKTKELAAQELVAAQTNKQSKLKSVIIEGAGIDTTYSYAWDYTAQDWNSQPYAQMISTYDENHNLVEYRINSWQYEQQYWLDSLLFVYKYNEANQKVNAMQQSYQFDGENYFWGFMDNTITEYNDLGQESRFLYQTWDYDNNGWGDNWQHEFKYNEKGENIIVIESYWDGDQWNPSICSNYNYDDQGHIGVNPMQIWDYNINDWIYSFQYLYKYDSLGNNINMLLQTWDPNGELWNDCFLKTMCYNESNKIDNYIYQSWDPFLFEWQNNQRGFYKYDSKGNIILIVGQDYNAYADTWSSSWETVYTYNDQNKKTSEESLYWSMELGSWYAGSKTKSYKIGSDNKGDNKHYVNIQLQVFPNPTIDYVNIYNTTIALVRVLDMKGREVLSQNFKGLNNIQMDISSLPSGTYFLMIQDLEGNASTKKIVKI